MVRYSIFLNGIDAKATISKHLDVGRGHRSTDANISLLEEVEDDFGDLYTMNVTQLTHEHSPNYISFLDPHQNRVKMWITMIDLIRGGPLSIKTDQPCWWCREPFPTSPIGIPVRYCPHKLDGFLKNVVEKNLLKYNLPLEPNDFFETDGIACSFPCALALITEEIKKSNVIYKDSPTLLTQLYYKIFGKVVEIKAAGSWKLLKRWGGEFTIEEFRSAFCKLVYKATINIKRPLMYSMGSYFTEHKIIN